MKGAIKILTLIHILYMLLSSLAASVGEPFRVPLSVIFVLGLVSLGNLAARRMRAEREAVSGVSEPAPSLIGLDSAGIGLTLPLILPTLGVIFLVSFLTSVILGAFGIVGEPVPQAPLFEMLVEYALIPCIFEEMIFRYLPMKLIAPYSERWCIILSSLYFALAHVNLTQIPYALVAGLVFITISLMTKSVLPSVILHFLNNFISVLWIKYSSDTTFLIWYVALLSVGALLSLIPVFIMRKKYISGLREMLRGGERPGEIYAPLLFLLFTGGLMILNMFS